MEYLKTPFDYTRRIPTPDEAARHRRILLVEHQRSVISERLYNSDGHRPVEISEGTLGEELLPELQAELRVAGWDWIHRRTSWFGKLRYFDPSGNYKFFRRN